MEGNFSDIFCPNCRAPAKFDIISGQYLCHHCDSKVEIKEALAQKQGFRSIQQIRIKESAAKHHLLSANCSGCGAAIVFEENEALSGCAFCGRSLVRKDYLSAEEMPELIVPFRITEDEARSCLDEWCHMNSGKREAKYLRDKTDGLKGFYLPYELIRGPVNCSVSRMDSSRKYNCRGYVDNIFVNCSAQLDNLLLDGMEPYELNELKEFDFSYVAGQRIKIGDVSADRLQNRVSNEIANDYTPLVEKTLETKAVNVNTDSESVLRMPVLMPVYYICSGDIMAAVNGQTGKVSVRAEKISYHYFIPWWAKAILSTLLISAVAFAAFFIFGWSTLESLEFAGILAAITIIVTLILFSDTVKNKFKVESVRKIFSSSGGPLRRIDGRLIRDEIEIKKEVTPPVFFEELEGKLKPVQLKFTSPLRTLKTILLSLVALFLPVIVALFLNGFDFGRLELGGSAAWFCVAVPVVPIYILKFARVELYERPWIYIIAADGTKKRYRKKYESIITKGIVKKILKLLFIPPKCFAVWLGLIAFYVMCFLTAFGFD